MINTIYGLTAVLGVIFIWWLISLIWGKPWYINLFYSRVFLEVLFKNPEILTMLGMLERIGFNRHNAKLSDASEAHTVKMLEKMKRNLKILRSYDRERQSEVQLLSTDILDWFIDDRLRGEAFRHHDYPINQMFGLQSSLPDLMMNIHPINNKRNGWNYVKRLQKFAPKFEQILEGLHIREAKGCLPPHFTIQHVLNEMQTFIDQPATENPLYTVFAEKLGELNLSNAQQEQLLTAVKDEILQTVYPTYQKLIDYFTQLASKVSGNHGVWQLPDGDAYYAYCLRSNTSTNLTPEEVHNIGLQEVARIEAEMKRILEKTGHNSENPTQTLLALSEEERFLYPNTEEGRASCLADYQQIIDEINQSLDPLFEIRPKADVVVKRIPEFKEKTSPGAYYQPGDLGGKRPGVFFANLRDMKETAKLGMKTLTYHEAIPGHHFQIAIAMELKGVPFFRRMIPFTAYAEGWAMYAENLAHEHGAYEDDPYGELGYLDSILFRAVRLVVDTGIHYKRWTREQAIEYMQAHTGQAYESIVSEIERYFVMPGQACAYKVGELKMLELRAHAQHELGEKFDIRQFHNVVLKNGSMPLILLEQVVKEYIAAIK